MIDPLLKGLQHVHFDLRLLLGGMKTSLLYQAENVVALQEWRNIRLSSRPLVALSKLMSIQISTGQLLPAKLVLLLNPYVPGILSNT